MFYTFVNGQKKAVKSFYTFINGQKKNVHTIYTFINGQKKYLFQTINTTLLYSNTAAGSFTWSIDNINFRYVDIIFAGGNGTPGTVATAIENGGRGGVYVLTLNNPTKINITNGVIGSKGGSPAGGTGKSNGSSGSQLTASDGSYLSTYSAGGGGSTGFNLSVNNGAATSYEVSAGGGYGRRLTTSSGSTTRVYTKAGGKGGGPHGGAAGIAPTTGSNVYSKGGDSTDGNYGVNEHSYNNGVGWIKIVGYNTSYNKADYFPPK